MRLWDEIFVDRYLYLKAREVVIKISKIIEM